MRQIAVFLLVLLFTSGEIVAAEPGALMHIGFEGSMVNSVTSQEGEAKDVIFVQGKVGQGGRFEKGSYLRFPAKNNINYRKGTVEFWFQPAWRGDDGGYHYFFAGNIEDAGNINSIHVSKKAYDGGVLLGQIDSAANEQGLANEEDNVPGGTDFSASSVSHWQPGEWHHIAFSWDAEKTSLKLYIDGLLIASNPKARPAAFPSGEEPFILIGASIDQKFFAEGVIDELKVWDRPLSDVEIAKVAGLEVAEIGESENQRNPLVIIGIVLGIILGLFLIFYMIGRVLRKRRGHAL